MKAALEASRVSSTVKTIFAERHKGTDRNRNGCKAGKTYGVSMGWGAHKAMTYFAMYSYNFCWPVWTLREHIGRRRYR